MIYEIYWNEFIPLIGHEKFFKLYHDYDSEDVFDICLSASKCLCYGFDKLSKESQEKITRYIKGTSKLLNK